MYIIFIEDPSGWHLVTRTMFKTTQGACEFLNNTNREEIQESRDILGAFRPSAFEPHYAGEGYRSTPFANRNARIVLVELEEE